MMSPGAPPPVGVWRAAWVVWLKELVDTLRDRRTLLVVLLSSVALGPVMLGLMSRLVADLEEDLGRRDVHVIGLAQAPTLANYLARQGLVLHEAPPDAAQALADGQLAHPLLQVPPDFEPALAQGLAPRLLVLTHSGQRRVTPRRPACSATCRALCKSRPACVWCCAGCRRRCCRRCGWTSWTPPRRASAGRSSPACCPCSC